MGKFFRTYLPEEPLVPPGYDEYEFEPMEAFAAYVARCGGDPVKTTNHFRFIGVHL